MPIENRETRRLLKKINDYLRENKSVKAFLVVRDLEQHLSELDEDRRFIKAGQFIDVTI